ncbi:hypothetical protein MKX03_005373 [Papaver bracteatum]|nr:hypothetical protein MKX03_024500 [Papaver bracteatum]KAI3878689.1 hypothetical protein MKX03_005373 [Papaver bracteatum]
MAICTKLNLVRVLITFVFVTLGTEVVDASFMEVWKTYSNCGCSAIHQNGDYRFIYQGQDVFLYNEEGCQGDVQTQLGCITVDCKPFGWKSLRIQC